MESGDYITLDLNGPTFDRNRSSSSSSGYAFLIESGGDFVLEDTSSDALSEQGKVTGGNISDLSGGGGAMKIKKGGTFTLNGGNLCENKANDRGGAIFNEGTLIMNGGGICNNTTTGNGGGVSNFGVFIMNGGEIVGNKAADAGGGVYNYGNTFSISGPGSFTMNGGKISQNTGKWGGGIQSSGSLTVNGEVSDNTAWFGGGIHSEDKGQVVSRVVIQNSAKIKNNSAFNDSDGGSGGGIYFQDGTLQIQGGSISNNSSRYGGGIYAQSTDEYMSQSKTASVNISGGSIAGNTAEKYGGGLDIWNTNLTMTDGEISLNNGLWGGGIHLGGGVFQLLGGAITKNNAGSSWGGGVYFSDGTVSLKNGVAITDNVYGGTITDGTLIGGTVNNFLLPVDQTVSASNLNSSAQIVVTTEAVPTKDAPVDITGIGSSDDSSHFTSDEGYTVAFDSTKGAVQLQYKSTYTSDRDNDEHDFWIEVKDEISDADSGDVIKVNAKGYDKMPYSVMSELRKNSGVSLVIRWNGGEDIIIPAGQARPAESLRIYYPLSLLEELYAGKSLTDPVTGKPIDPSKLNPNTGGVLEIDAPPAADISGSGWAGHCGRSAWDC